MGPGLGKRVKSLGERGSALLCMELCLRASMLWAFLMNCSQGQRRNRRPLHYSSPAEVPRLGLSVPDPMPFAASPMLASPERDWDNIGCLWY